MAGGSVGSSELDFHIWNAKLVMKCEAKMAALGGQFYTSVLVPYAVLCVSFSLPHDFLQFPEEFSLKIHTKYFLKFNNFSIFRQNQTELQAIYFHENKLPNYRETC